MYKNSYPAVLFKYKEQFDKKNPDKETNIIFENHKMIFTIILSKKINVNVSTTMNEANNIQTDISFEVFNGHYFHTYYTVSFCEPTLLSEINIEHSLIPYINDFISKIKKFKKEDKINDEHN